MTGELSSGEKHALLKLREMENQSKSLHKHLPLPVQPFGMSSERQKQAVDQGKHQQLMTEISVRESSVKTNPETSDCWNCQHPSECITIQKKTLFTAEEQLYLSGKCLFQCLLTITFMQKTPASGYIQVIVTVDRFIKGEATLPKITPGRSISQIRPLSLFTGKLGWNLPQERTGTGLNCHEKSSV